MRSGRRIRWTGVFSMVSGGRSSPIGCSYQGLAHVRGRKLPDLRRSGHNQGLDSSRAETGKIPKETELSSPRMLGRSAVRRDTALPRSPSASFESVSLHINPAATKDPSHHACLLIAPCRVLAASGRGVWISRTLIHAAFTKSVLPSADLSSTTIISQEERC